MNLEVLTHTPTGSPKPTPLLFVHGAWHGAWCWDDHFLPFFAEQGYVAHALSLRNHGKSPSRGNTRFLRLKSYVEDVAQVAASLPTPPVVIGHSMGGLVVQKYLEAHPAPGAVLMAACPPGHGAWAATWRTFRYSPLMMLRVNLLLDMYQVVKQPADARHAFFSEDMPPEELTKHHVRLGQESFVGYLGMLGLELPRPKRIKTPMLVLGGEDDQIFAPWEVRRTAHVYNADCQIFPNMAHDMMLEAGWQSVAQRILEWLGKHGL